MHTHTFHELACIVRQGYTLNLARGQSLGREIGSPPTDPLAKER